MIDIAAAISSTAGLLGLAKAAVAARDDAKAQQAIADVQMKLLEVSTAALAMTQINISLTDEIRLLKDKSEKLQMEASDRQRYTLTEVCSGAYAYQSEPDQKRADAPSHYLCQPCYDQGVKSVLRFFKTDGVRELSSPYETWSCPVNPKHSFAR